jgi:hypothetical protein
MIKPEHKHLYSKLEVFWDTLNKYRLPKEAAKERENWCHLLVKYDGKIHRFQVRYATYVGDVQEKACDIIYLSVVNWTMCAGTASLELTEKNVSDWVIEEEPTAKLLYKE